MMKKIILIFIIFASSMFSQDETSPVSNLNEPRKQVEKTSPENEKKYSAQLILGGGRGNLSIVNDKFDPTTSLSEFIALALFSANQASPGYASSLAANLGANSLLALYLLNDELSSSAIRSESTSSIKRFYLENKHKNDSIGLQFGISSGSYAFKPDSSRYSNVFLPYVFFGGTNPLTNIYMAQSFVKNSQPIYLGVDTFDLAIKYHYFPEDKFDLYLSTGLGIGSCFTGCTAMRFFGRVGVRYNMEDYYIFIEEEIQSVLFSMKEKKYNPMQEKISLLGFGFYL